MAFTYFFRDMYTLELITKAVVPYISGKSNIKFWDAGCAMGQEAYSLAIVFAENLGNFAFKNLHINATDIDGSNLFEQIIQSGEYSEGEIKRIPENIRNKYFNSNDSGQFQVIDKIRTCVDYRKHDLLSLETIGSKYSLILCKNVLLHFSPTQRVEVIKMFHKSLDTNGFMATEQTQQLPQEVSHLFKQVSNDARLYQKIGVEE